jgi:undecaprenyl-diphosphatase
VVPLTIAFRRSFALRLAVGFLAAAAILTIIGLFAKAGSFQYPDEAIRDYIKALEFPALTTAMLLMTRLGSTYVLTPLGLLVILIFSFLRWWQPIALFLLAMAGQAILHVGCKWLFDIDRPEALLSYVIGDTPSFPSGHATASLSFYGILTLLITARIASKIIKQTIWILAAILVFLIGFSRIYFGVHHPSDVIAGFLAASVWIWAVASGDDKL